VQFGHMDSAMCLLFSLPFNNLHCRFMIFGKKNVICIMCRIDERDFLSRLVEKALSCKSCLREIVIHASANVDEDISIVSEKLATAVKACIYLTYLSISCIIPLNWNRVNFA